MSRTHFAFALVLTILCFAAAYTGLTMAVPAPGNGLRCNIGAGTACQPGYCCDWTYVPSPTGGPGSWTFTITTANQLYPLCQPGSSSDNCTTVQFACAGDEWSQPWDPNGPWICDFTSDPPHSFKLPIVGSCNFDSCTP